MNTLGTGEVLLLDCLTPDHYRGDPQEALYRRAGVTPEREVITYCGRGCAGACGVLALRLLGHGNVRLYDGSWLEWSADDRLPVEREPA